jgi:hypothetical protein
MEDEKNYDETKSPIPNYFFRERSQNLCGNFVFH